MNSPDVIHEPPVHTFRLLPLTKVGKIVKRNILHEDGNVGKRLEYLSFSLIGTFMKERHSN